MVNRSHHFRPSSLGTNMTFADPPIRSAYVGINHLVARVYGYKVIRMIVWVVGLMLIAVEGVW
jgi:hypothetical protein